MDEGHVLHPTEQLLRSGSWDPGYYGYPPLTFYLISVAAKGVDYFQSAVTTGRSLVEGIPSHDEVDTPAGPLYDILGPTELIVTGRLVMLLLGIGTVLVTGLLGGSLFGPRTGWVAALLVACCPSFVRRGSFVMVDTPTAFFAVLALYFVARYRRSARDVDDDAARSAHFLAFGAGLAGALAAASKYSAVVLVPVALIAVLVAAPTVSRAVRSAVALGAGFLTGLALGLPTLALRFHETVSALRIQTGLYEYWEATASYWQSAVQTYELGVPLLLCAAAGLWQMLRRREHRATAWTWLLFATLLTLPFLRYGFQPFRNLLPLCPLVAVAGAHFIVGAFGRPQGEKSSLRARSVGVLAAVAVALSFGAGLVRFHDGLVRRDSRVEAIDWLAQRVQPGDQVLVLRELAILPSEIRRLPVETRVLPCRSLKRLASSARSAYLVIGVPQQDAPAGGAMGASCDALFTSASEVASFGSVPTSPNPTFWRTNREALRILKITDPATLSPSPEPPSVQRPF
ncbi:MAG: phospholipid carrier-dependent glycosyltransferase [Thermoanaerobaculia bacterium]|nr:phospholipid carrier-dependent glycosyltransferase [Thermoanaerobaculia bacterium]